jgi:flagellar motor switch protein FliN/FliY
MATDNVPNPAADGGSPSAAEAALAAAQAAIAMAKQAQAAPAPAPSTSAADEAVEAEMLAMMAQAGAAGASAPAAGARASATAPLNLPSFGAAPTKALPKGIDLLGDVNLNVRIELGRTRMLLEDVLKLGDGTVVELDKLAGDPVDIFVNDRPVARGEVLVLNDNFCVRISEILSKEAIDAAVDAAAKARV